MKGQWWGVSGSFLRLAVFGALLAACSASAPAAERQASVPSTTIGPYNPYAVPSHITAAYVQRVLNGLEAIQAHATSEIVSARSLTPDAVANLKAIFAADVFVDQINLWVSQIPNGLGSYKHPTGAVQDRLTAVMTTRPTCLFVTAVRDFSAVTTKQPAPHTTFVELVPVTPANDPGHLNPTPWVFGELGYDANGQRPPDPCAVSF